jgi:O-antigen ligase
VGERIEGQGIGGTLRGLQVSQGFGLGVGAGTQTGNLQLDTQRQSIEGLNYAAEGGGGRIVLEMGLPGLVVMGMMGFLVALMLWRNFRLLKLLPPPTAALMIGLVAFPIANIGIFSSAGQLYNDPFVLIMLAICLGSFFAVPSLVALHQQQLMIQQQMAAQAFQRRSLPLA